MPVPIHRAAGVSAATSYVGPPAGGRVSGSAAGREAGRARRSRRKPCRITGSVGEKWDVQGGCWREAFKGLRRLDDMQAGAPGAPGLGGWQTPLGAAWWRRDPGAKVP